MDEFRSRPGTTHRGGVLKGVLDICLPQENVSPAHPPQHPLEGGNPLPANHSGHKPAGVTEMLIKIGALPETSPGCDQNA